MNNRNFRAVASAFVVSWVLLAIWSPATVLAAAPSNDNFASRIVVDPLSLPFTDMQDTTDATIETGEPASSCGAVSHSIWYEFTPDISWVYMLYTYGSSYNTVVDLFTSSSTPASLGTLTPVNCNNDANPPADTTSLLSVFLTAGTTYYIRVSGASGVGGTSVLNVVQRGPATTATATADGNPYAFGSWTNQDVTVTLHAAYNDLPGADSEAFVTGTFYTVDGGSPQSYSSPFVVSDEGVHMVQFWSEDTNGRTEPAHTVQVKIDKTPPTVTYTGNAGVYTLGQMVNITCTAEDSLSGIASTTCADITGLASTFGSGTHTFSATATDMAGNVGSGSTTFVVIAGLDDLCALTQQYETNPGIADAMCAKLAAAAASDARGNESAKAGQLNAYKNHVEAQRGKTLTDEQADTLIRLADAL